MPGLRERRVLLAMSDFKHRVSAWAQKLRTSPKQIVVMEMKWKWASCSDKGRVCFARDVLELPLRLQDYIIIHELLHLKHPNHGRVFQSVLRATIPEWRSLHENLRDLSVREISGSPPKLPLEKQ